MTGAIEEVADAELMPMYETNVFGLLRVTRAFLPQFRKQGSAWVDQKFKSSMTLKSVARTSDEFNALDSGLRSIAQQLGGEVIVVWKGKAYLIK